MIEISASSEDTAGEEFGGEQGQEQPSAATPAPTAAPPETTPAPTEASGENTPAVTPEPSEAPSGTQESSDGTFTPGEDIQLPIAP